MRMLLLNFLLLWAMFLCGCARRPIGVNYLVEPECRPRVRLLDCDRASPPHCQKISAVFPKGCEKLEAH
jgi:hypothetical protein